MVTSPRSRSGSRKSKKPSPKPPAKPLPLDPLAELLTKTIRVPALPDDSLRTLDAIVLQWVKGCRSGLTVTGQALQVAKGNEGLQKQKAYWENSLATVEWIHRRLRSLRVSEFWTVQ